VYFFGCGLETAGSFLVTTPQCARTADYAELLMQAITLFPEAD